MVICYDCCWLWPLLYTADIRTATVCFFDDHQYELFEEALLIYTKCGKKSEGEEKTAMHVSAAEVLVDNLKDLNRAKDFAERVADSAVWSKVGEWFIDCASLWKPH